MRPSLSVVTALYRRHVFLDKAYHSIVSQSIQDWEWILVQDGDAAEVTAAALRLAKADDRIRYVRRATVGSIGEACNYAIKMAVGEFIAILDDDDEWVGKDKLKSQLDFLTAHPDYVGCGGAYHVCDVEGRVLSTHVKPKYDNEIRRMALLANPIANSSSVFRRGAALAIGGYDCTLRDFQDWDFWLRLAEVGKLYNFEEVLLNYRIWREGSSVRNIRSNADSALTIIRRHKDRFPRYRRAALIYYAYWAFSRMPSYYVGGAFSFFSRLKKTLFSTAGRPNIH